MNKTPGPRRPLRRSGPTLVRFEPRMMFDGAAIVHALHVEAAPLPEHVDAATLPTEVGHVDPAPTPTPETAPEPASSSDKGSPGTPPPAVAPAEIDRSASDATAGLDAAGRDARAAIASYLNSGSGIEGLAALFHDGQDVPSADWLACAEGLRAEIAGGTWSVSFQFASAAEMGGAYAAFAAAGPDGTPIIFVNRAWWETESDAGARIRTLVEEYGHAIDDRLNSGSDTAGDEGEAFAAQVLGLQTAFIDQARMGVENDHRDISVDGRVYAVETATISFLNAYRVHAGSGFLAEKEQNRHNFIDTSLGASVVTDLQLSSTFSGNDVVARLTVNGANYYGWVSRPIKEGGIVRGFYFWYDTNFTSLADATADGNSDGDRTAVDNNAFILVVDQAYFNALPVAGTTAGGSVYKFVGSSSDRVDSALNALLTPNRAPTPANDSLTVLEDGGSRTGNVLANDLDADGTPLTVTGFSINGVAGTVGQTFTMAGVGQFTLTATGDYSFTPVSNYTGPVPAISYTVSDGVDTATATLSIAITGVNDAPAGADKIITMDEDSSYTFTSRDFGFSDAGDVPGNSLASVVITSLPAVGRGSLTLNGVTVTAGQEILATDLSKLRFTPAPDGAGTAYASFTFQVRDNGGTANGGVDLDPTPNNITFTVTDLNDAPAPVADTALAREAWGVANGTAGTDPTGFLLTNDTDPDQDPLSVVGVTGFGATVAAAGSFTVTGRYGTLTVDAATGAYSYSLDNSNPAVQALRGAANTLSEVFAYTVGDSSNLRASSTLTVTIEGGNDAPVAVNDQAIAKESIAASGNYTGTDTTGYTATGNVLANDTDVDAGDGQTITGISGSALSGTITPGTTTTELHFQAQSTLSPVTAGDYVYYNGARLTTSGGTAIQVTSKSDLGGGNYSMTLSGTPSVMLDGKLVSFDAKNQATTPSSAKSATVSSSQSVGQTTIALSGVGGTVAAGMTLTWSGGSATVGSVTYDGSGAVTGIMVGTSVSISTGTALTFTGAAGSTITGRYGTLQLGATGSYTYTPIANNANLAEGQSGIDSFRYTMQDTAGASSSATLTVTVLGSGTNDPHAVADVNTIAENSVSVSGNVVTGTAGAGVDTTPMGTGSLTITQARSDSSATETAVATDTVITGRYGTLTISSTGAYSYALANGNPAVDALRLSTDTLTDVFFYRVSNSTRSDVTTLTITITGANDAPVATADAATAREAGGYANGTAGLDPTGTVLLNDTDVDTGDSRTVTAVQAGSGLGGSPATVAAGSSAANNGRSVTGTYGTLVIGADGSYAYAVDNANAAVQALALGGTLTDSFSYRVTDAAGQSGTAVLAVTIQGANDAPTVVAPGSTILVAEAAQASIAGIGVADVDDASLTVQLAVDNGIVSIGDLNGVVIQSGGSGTAALTLSGTKAQLNAALATLGYQGATGFSGDDRLSIRTSDAAGLAATASVAITVTPDNRSLTVAGTTVNEASPYLLFTVAGVSGQTVSLALETSGSGSGHAAIGTDLLPNLDYFDGTDWQAYTGAPVGIPSGGTLLVRSAVLNDAAYEGAETVRLVATNKAGTAFRGTGTIIDDGSGAVFLPGNKTPTADAGGAGFPAYPDDDRTLSVNDIAVNEASPFAVFTVSGHAGQIVRLALAEGTAGAADHGAALSYFDGQAWVGYTPGSDLTLTGSTLLVRTSITQDAVFEGQEAFFLTVTRVSAGTAIHGTASIYDDGTGSVFLEGNTGGTPNGSGDTGFPAALDDDRSLTVGSPVVNEASDYAVFTLTGDPGQTVTLALQNQTASIDAGQTLKIWDGLDWVDYSTAAALPTFDAQGRVLVRVDIRAEQDTVYEGAETAQLVATLTGRSTGVTGTATIVDDGTGVIHDVTTGPVTESTTGLDDDRPTITHVGDGTVSSVTVTEGAAAVFTVTLSNASTSSSNFALSLGSGTATLGADFTAALVFSNGVSLSNGVITVPAGVTSFTVTVPTVPDSGTEAAETFTLAVGGASGTGTILDAGVVTITHVGDGTVGSVTVTEGTAAVFTVSLSGASAAAESYAFSLTGGTATLGTDFTSALVFSNGVSLNNGVITVPAGVTSFTVTVPTVDDVVKEPAEGFSLSIGGVGASGTILDNDSVTVSHVGDGTVGSVTVTEGTAAVFTVSLSGASAAAESYAFSLTGGTATLGADFTSALVFSNGVSFNNGVITVPAGVTSFTVTVPTVDDAVKEPAEGFSLSIGGVGASGTILDNDPVMVSRIDGPSGDAAVVTEGQPAVITVSLSGVSTTPENYPLVLSGGTATLGTDFATNLIFSEGVSYDAATGRVTVPAGVARFTVTVGTIDDTGVETPERFTLAVGGQTAAVLIVDNDVVPPPETVVAPPPAATAPAATTVVSVPVVVVTAPSPGFAPLVEPALTPFSTIASADLPARIDDIAGRTLQHELRVDKPLPEVLVPPGTRVVDYVLPTDAFVHTDKTAQIELSALMLDGSRLPGWLSFDAKKGEFFGTPPAGFKGELQIRVVARDEAGRQAETMVRIRVTERVEQSAQLQGKAGLSRQLQAGGALAWKGERDRLVAQANNLARAVKAGRTNGTVG